MVKKEKIEETPASKPAHTPATRSAKRRKASDPVIHLESFEGLTAEEIKEKTLSFQSMTNLVRFLIFPPVIKPYLPWILCAGRRSTVSASEKAGG